LPIYYNNSFEEIIAQLSSKGYKFLCLPKYDGTCIQCFTDECGVKHRHTLGSLEKNKIGTSEFTYHNITERLLSQNYPKLHKFLEDNKGISLICELITPYNVIKTVYNLSHLPYGMLMPIVFIDLQGMPFFDYSIYQDVNWEFNADNYNKIIDIALNVLQNSPNIFGNNPEGLVTYCYNQTDNSSIMRCVPLCKIKCEKYVNAQLIESPCYLQNRVINGTIDDINTSLEESEYVDSFKKYLSRASKEITTADLFNGCSTRRQFNCALNELPIKLQIYNDALIELRKCGFDNVNILSEYDFIIQLLNLEIKNNGIKQKFITILQNKYGSGWFN
jgi:hypothetical protein